MPLAKNEVEWTVRFFETAFEKNEAPVQSVSAGPAASLDSRTIGWGGKVVIQGQILKRRGGRAGRALSRLHNRQRTIVVAPRTCADEEFGIVEAAVDVSYPCTPPAAPTDVNRGKEPQPLRPVSTVPARRCFASGAGGLVQHPHCV